MTDKTEEQPEALRLDESKRYSDVVHHANVKASIAYVARKTGLGYQETGRLLELALQRGDLTEGDYSGRKMEKIADDRLASLEAQLVAQTNRAAAAEQQVTALTQRLDTANALNTEARNQLATQAGNSGSLQEMSNINELPGSITDVGIPKSAQLSARQAVVPDGFVSIYESNARGIFAQTPTKMHGGPEHNWRPVAFIDAETDALGLPLPHLSGSR